MEKKNKKYGFGTLYKPKIFTKEDLKIDLKKWNIQPPKIEIPRIKTVVENKDRKQEEKEKPYWAAEQWEEWAMQIYDNYPDMREYLPKWFLEAVEK